MDYNLSADMKRFHHLMAETNQVYRTIAQALGLSDSAFEVLYTLCCLGDGSPLRQVVRQSFLPKQTVNSALRKLEKDGLLSLETAGSKNKHLRLTPEGRDLCREKILPVLALEDRIFQTWTQSERTEYLRLTQRYLSDLRAAAEGMEGRL